MQGCTRHQTLLNSVLGVNLGDLYCLTHHVAGMPTCSPPPNAVEACSKRKPSLTTTTTTTRNGDVDDLLGTALLERRVGQDRRFFHQLFHHLPRRTRCRGDLGYFDNLLGNRQVHETKGIHNCLHHLLHRKIEKLHEGADVAHVPPPSAAVLAPASQQPKIEVLADPRALPPTTGRVPALELDVQCVATVVLAVFCPRRATCCSCLPTHSSLNFGGNGVEGLGKDHAHGLPLVLKPRAQLALSPPLGGSRHVFAMQRHVDH